MSQKLVRCNLKKLLDERGMLQKELARNTGIRPATVSALYTGKVRHYPADVIERIVNELQLESVSELITIIDTEDDAQE
ncbi:helix-turn-helix domain-containing protein [Alkalicoccus chagannorensis]|uniref:helix-turn-helix domain-containing protein n=1 Tax=Alkalicoccus chagannorensis TaxID=427072 RepID=UPI00041A91D9|nr:helix-turn-helix transcriptional regulator [Alkalicoccus chagannorensis]